MKIEEAIQMKNISISENQTKRIKWIDIYKGIAIITVILGHTAGMMPRYVYLFHMAAFFFISGYTEKFEEKSILEIFRNKVNSLIIPYIGINVFALIIRGILEVFHIQGMFYNECINLTNIKSYLRELLRINWTADLAGATWFLIALFWAFIVAKLLVYITKNEINIITVVITLVIFLGVYKIFEADIFIKYFFDLGLNATFYVVLGRYIYKKQWLEKTKIRNNKLVILSTIIYFYIFGNVLHNTVDYPSRCFNNPYMDILCSIIGIILIYNISIKIENSRYSEYIEYFGKSSLGLLGIHFFIIRIIFVGEVIISVSEVSMLKNLIPTGEKYDCFIYTVLVLYIFKKMNDKLSRNRVYSTVFLGKYKGNIIQNNSLKCIITVICVVLMMVVVGTSIPYNKVAATFMQSVDKSKIVLDGQYEDGFVGESAKFYYSSEKARQLDLDIWVTEYTEQNKLTIVNGEEEIQSIDLKSGDNQIVLDIPANINGYIQMKFANTFIPDEIQKNGDKRQLSVVIKKIQIKP